MSDPVRNQEQATDFQKRTKWVEFTSELKYTLALVLVVTFQRFTGFPTHAPYCFLTHLIR